MRLSACLLRFVTLRSLLDSKVRYHTPIYITHFQRVHQLPTHEFSAPILTDTPTCRLSEPASSEQLQSSSQVVRSAKDLLRSCPTTRYLLVSQSNLNVAHLAAGEAVPNFYQSLEQAESRFSVAEVAGHLDVKELSNYIREVCDGKSASVDEVDLEPLAPTQSATLKENGTP